MSSQLIINGNAVYEVDLKCKNEQKEKNRRKEYASTQTATEKSVRKSK